MSLRLLLDNADPKTWEEFFPSSFFAGITTNPSLLLKANQPCNINQFKTLSKKAEQLGCRELHLQVWGENEEELIQCGYELSLLKTTHLKIHIKVPATWIGIRAANILIRKSIPITLTACYQAKQVLIASAIGASHIAPYLGRINDLGINGISELKTMQKLLDGHGSTCKLLVASIRNTNELVELASAGINTFTISSKIAKELYEVSETRIAAENFQKDALLSSK